MDYNAYMQSASWKTKRQQRLVIDKHRCRFCGHTGDSSSWLEVHHLPGSYELIPNESVTDDLITVCVRCHRLLTGAIRKDRAIAKQPLRRFQVNRRMWQIAAVVFAIVIPFLIYVTR